MQWEDWDEKTQEAFRALGAYQRAYDDFAIAKPTPPAAREVLTAAYARLRTAVSDPAVAGRIAEVLRTPDAAQMDVRRYEKELDFELKLSRFFGLNYRRLKSHLQGSETPLPSFDSSEDFLKQLDSLHEAALAELDSARSEKPRLKKKKRKRDIAQGVTSFLFGTGCAIANSYLLPGMPAMALSYSATLTAFHQATKDIIGKKDD